MEEKENKELTLEEAFEGLDRIIEALENRETSLEASFEYYKQGMDLIRTCSEKIDLVEKKVLVMNEEGEMDEFQ